MEGSRAAWLPGTQDPERAGACHAGQHSWGGAFVTQQAVPSTLPVNWEET